MTNRLPSSQSNPTVFMHFVKQYSFSLKSTHRLASNLLTLALLFVGVVGWGQTNTFNNASGNNWNTTANWSLGIVPTSAHNVVIPNNENVTVNTSAVCASLTIGGGASDNTITISGTNSLNVTGTITINGGTTTGGGANDDKIIAVGSGTLTCATLTIANTGADGDDSEVTISTGTVTVSGNITMSGNNQRNAIRFSSTGKLNIGGSISGGDIIPSTGTVNYNGTSAQTVAINADYVYNNLTVNNTAGAILQASITATNVTGNLSVQSGTLNNGGFAITLAGGSDFTVSNGATFNLTGSSGMVTVSGGGTRTLEATSSVNYNGTAQTVATLIYGNLGISGSGNKTFSAATTILGDLSINSTAVANLGTFTHNATRLLFNGSNQLTGSWGHTTSPATNENDTFFANATGIVNVGSGSQTLTTSGSFIVPTGVTSITVQTWGGGGGTTANNNGEAGGGGGAYASSVLTPVSPGQTFTVTIGNGGGAGVGGGTTSFGTDVIALGGSSNTTNQTGAQGGQASGSTGTIKFSGGNGGNGSTPSGGGGGGGGSSATAAGAGVNGGNFSGANGGAGGNGTNGDGGDGGDNGVSNAQPGTAPGGGGGGRGDTGGTSGSGANGQVIITWVVSTCPTITAVLSGDATICNGGSSNLVVTITGGATPYDIVYSGGTENNYTSGANIPVSPGSTTVYTLTTVTDNDGCTATVSGTATVTVEADPTAPTLNVATPASGTTVCAGQDVSATFNAGSGGTGCTDEYQFSTNGGSTYAAYTPGNAISTTGLAGQTVIIQGRRICSGNGCDGAAETFATLATWTVVADPTAPTLNVATPSSGTTVCAGQDVSATFNAGSGGTGCTDEYQFSTNGGGTYTAYTPGNAISTTGLAGQTVIIQGRRICSGNGCDGAAETFATLATWTIAAIPTAFTVTGGGAFCSGGGGVPVGLSGSQTNTNYQLKIGGVDTGSPVSGDGNPISFGNQTVAGTYTVVATSTLAGNCTATMTGSVNVAVNPLPTAGTCNMIGDLCQTSDGSLDISASGGTPPYSVTWTPVSGMSQPQVITNSGDIISITGLIGGTAYLFVVKDANNCQAP